MLTFNLRDFELLSETGRAKLSPQEARLLLCLIAEKEVSWEKLSKDLKKNLANIRVLLFRLRRVLAHLGERNLIWTERGKGLFLSQPIKLEINGILDSKIS